MAYIYIILSTTLISLGSITGIFLLSIRKSFNKILLYLVSLSAGTMLGGAFLHLLPESVENLDPKNAFLTTLFSFSLFFITQRFLHWHHCHSTDCKHHSKHTLGVMNLLGDSLHNFLDGLIIAGAFLTDFSLGIVTSITIALHEIPQEISDFGVIVYSGFSKRKALFVNFVVASTVILGGIVGYFITENIESIQVFLLPFAAGGFIYIAASDLLPELKKDHKITKSLGTFAVFLIGIMLMYLLTFFE